MRVGRGMGGSGGGAQEGGGALARRVALSERTRVDVRLSEIELSGYGPFEDCKIVVPDARVVLFEGPNGSGKTSVIEAIAVGLDPQSTGFFTGMDGFTLDRTEFGSPGGRVAGRRRAGRARGRLSMASDVTGTHDLRLFTPHREGRSPLEPVFGTLDDPFTWACFAYRAHMESPVLVDRGVRHRWSARSGCLSFGHLADAGVTQRLGALVRDSVTQRLLHQEQASKETNTQARDQLLSAAESYAELPERIGSVLSSVLDQSVELAMQAGVSEPVFRLRGEVIDPDNLGEGIRSTFAWLSDLLIRLYHWDSKMMGGPPTDRPFMLLLDEVDESLHPQLQAKLYPALLTLFPNVRIIASTHSPFVVASLSEGVVIPLRPDADGRVRGTIEPRILQPGTSLEMVTSDIFKTAFELLDPVSNKAIRDYEAAVARYARSKSAEAMDEVIRQRRALFDMNDDLNLKVGLIESPIRRDINAALARLPSSAGGDAT